MNFPDTTPTVVMEACPYGCGQMVHRFDREKRLAHIEEVHRGEHFDRLAKHGFWPKVSILHGAPDVYNTP